jgi:hypothetical protein
VTELWSQTMRRLDETSIFSDRSRPTKPDTAATTIRDTADYTPILRRLALRAFELAGRLPWLALLTLRVFLAMTKTSPLACELAPTEATQFRGRGQRGERIATDLTAEKRRFQHA